MAVEVFHGSWQVSEVYLLDELSFIYHAHRVTPQNLSFILSDCGDCQYFQLQK